MTKPQRLNLATLLLTWQKTTWDIKLLYLLLFILPVQLGQHFWPEFAYIWGLRIDYLSPTIYLTDLIIIAMIGLAALNNNFRNLQHSAGFKIILIFLIWSTLGALLNNTGASWIKILKLVELFGLSLFVSCNWHRADVRLVLITLISGAIFQSFLAWGQFLTQSSAGLWLLGERAFNPTTPGISLVDLSGTQLLRPYGTFPHPNVLAGFLVSCLVIMLGQVLYIRVQTAALKWVYLVIFGLILSAVFISFSRSAWIVLMILFSLQVFWLRPAGFVMKLNWLKKIAIFLILVIIIWIAGPVIFDRFWSITTTDAHSLILRQKLNDAALVMISHSPILGVGPANFLYLLPQNFPLQETIRWIQPVHNIFLLIAAEHGMVGLLMIVGLLLAAFRNIILVQVGSGKQMIFLVMLGLVLLGLFDHYLWTLQQGQLMFFITLGLALSSDKL